MPTYEINMASSTSKSVSDLEPNQAFLVIDASTNTAKIICADSAGDDITIPLGGAAGAFIADPSGGGTVDAQARTAIVTIIDVLIARGLIASS